MTRTVDPSKKLKTFFNLHVFRVCVLASRADELKLAREKMWQVTKRNTSEVYIDDKFACIFVRCVGLSKKNLIIKEIQKNINDVLIQSSKDGEKFE